MKKYLFVVTAVLIVSLTLMGCGEEGAEHAAGNGDDHSSQDGDGDGDRDDGKLAKMPVVKDGQGFDPVCGMMVDLPSKGGSVKFNGLEYNFCSSKHADDFAADEISFAYCPVTKELVDAKISKEINGKTYYFCCKDCVNEFKP